MKYSSNDKECLFIAISASRSAASSAVIELETNEHLSFILLCLYHVT